MHNIILADDQVLLRRKYKSYFEKIHNCKVIAEAQDGLELLYVLQMLKQLPDYVLIDLKMPKIDGIAVIDILSFLHPSMKCIAFTQFSDPNIIVDALMAGAKGYIQKGFEDEFENLFYELERGEIVVSKKHTAALQFFNECKNHRTNTDSVLNELTRREIIFLKLVSSGLSYEDISKLLFVSISTLNNHQANIKQKIGCSDKQLQTLFAQQNGIAKSLRFSSPHV